MTLPERAATGSSMMPQKLNPDVAELARAKAGTALGRLVGLLAALKGLPLAYSRDLQEDKPGVFEARRDVRNTLAALTVLVAGLEFRRDRMAEACADPQMRDGRRRGARREHAVPRSLRAGGRRVAAGSFLPPAAAAATCPGPGGVAQAMAQSRLGARPLS